MSTETYPYQGEYSRGLLARGRSEGLAEGRTQGKAASVLAVLEARGLAVTDEDRARIVNCSDLERLDVWIRRAITAGAVAELFG